MWSQFFLHHNRAPCCCPCHKSTGSSSAQRWSLHQSQAFRACVVRNPTESQISFCLVRHRWMGLAVSAEHQAEIESVVPATVAMHMPGSLPHLKSPFMGWPPLLDNPLLWCHTFEIPEVGPRGGQYPKAIPCWFCPPKSQNDSWHNPMQEHLFHSFLSKNNIHCALWVGSSSRSPPHNHPHNCMGLQGAEMIPEEAIGSWQVEVITAWRMGFHSTLEMEISP